MDKFSTFKLDLEKAPNQNDKMDKIDHFKIEVDISLCEKLYDYGNSEIIQKPSTGKWSKALLLVRPSKMVTASRGHSLNDTKHRIKRLDSVFHHLAVDEVMIPWSSDDDSGSSDDQNIGFAIPYGGYSPEPEDRPKFTIEEEEDDDVFEEKNVCDCIDLPPRILPLFRPGDTIKGFLHVTLRDDIPATQLVCKLEGSVKTKIRHRSILNTGSLRVQESFKRGKKECVSQAKCLWMDESGIMKRGEHKLMFEFMLPKDCPGSTPDLLPPEEKEYAYVGYRLKAILTQCNVPTKCTDRGHDDRHTDDIVVHRGLWVEKRVQISDIDTKFLKPYEKMEVMDTGVISRGRVSCQLKLSKRVFIRGEKISLILDINNSAKHDIQEITCRVKLKGHAKCNIGNQSLVKHFALKGTKVKQAGVAAGQKAVKKIDVMLDVKNAEVSLLPASLLNDSDLLEVDYVICVVLRRQGISKNLSLDIPIKVVSHE